MRARIRWNLERFEHAPGARTGLRAAAVAVVITDSDADDTACFLLTRRPAGLRRHGGQWALPGGRQDPGESAVQTALRELHEELGLALSPGRVLGTLDEYPTRSGFRITPVVVWGGPTGALQPDPEEVAQAYRVPLSDLDAEGVPRLHTIAQSDRPVLSVPVASLGTEVFSPTAAMLYQFREVALAGRAARVAHYEQPVFAWR